MLFPGIVLRLFKKKKKTAVKFSISVISHNHLSVAILMVILDVSRFCIICMKFYEYSCTCFLVDTHAGVEMLGHKGFNVHL